MGSLIKKAFVTTNEAEADTMVARFDAGTTSCTYNGAEYMVLVRGVDMHHLTQDEREALIEIPENFYTE